MEVNFDCLCTILEKLDIFDVMNMAEADDRYLPAAQSLYYRRHRMKIVFVNFGQISNDRIGYIELESKSAEIFCRHFGHLMLKLYINFMSQHASKLENLVLKHCADSLIELRLGWCNYRNFEDAEKPWASVQTLAITKGVLGPKMSLLSYWFPNLIYLKLSGVCFSGAQSFVARFHKLTTLVIYDEENAIGPTIINGMIRLNPQLESLVIQCDVNIGLLRSINESLPRLSELELYVPSDRFCKYDGNPIVFQRIKTFKLKSQCATGDHITHVPFEFPDLRSLQIMGFNEINFDIHLMNFILSHDKIEKITLVPKLDESHDINRKHLELFAKMPMLTDLEACVDNLTSSEIISFLMESKFLNKIKLWSTANSIDFDWIQCQTEIKWNLTRQIVKSSRYLLHFTRK